MMMRRQTDEQDSTVALWGNYLLCGLILGLLFVTDWFFSNKSIVRDTGWFLSRSADRVDWCDERVFLPIGSQ